MPGEVIQGGQPIIPAGQKQLLAEEQQGCAIVRGWVLWGIQWCLFSSDKAGESGRPQMDFWESHFPFSLCFMSPGNIILLVWVLHWPTSSYKSWEDLDKIQRIWWGRQNILFLLLASESAAFPHGLLLSLPADETLCYTSAFLQLARKEWGSAQWLCNSVLVYPDGFSVAEVIWMMNAFSA